MNEPEKFVAQRRESVDTIEMESAHNALLIWQSNGIPEPADCISLSVREARAVREYLDKVLPPSEARRDPTEAFDGGRPG